MALVAEWRAEVPTLDVLNRLVRDPPPLGLRIAGPVEQSFHRDTYFDAPDWSLRRRGVMCRFRVRIDDRRFLRVETLGRSEGAVTLVIPQTFEAEVPELEGSEALAGRSDPARRLRALIEPARLVARVELETERRIRRTRGRWFARAQFELVCDVVTVRSQQLSGSFQELKVRCLRPGRPSLDALAEAFQQSFGLRPLLVGKLDRAERLLSDLESAELARAVQGNREVAVVALLHGSLALHLHDGSLLVPVRRGSGQEGCRHVLREYFGSGDGQVRLLGTAPPVPTRPLLEVWLARRVGNPAAAANVQWVPLHEVVARVGSPLLHDPRTLAALAVAARSDLISEWPVTASGGAAPPAPEDGDSTERDGDGALTREWEIAVRRESRRISSVVERPRSLPEEFLNPELSWLHFNTRVLALAEDSELPLLARVRFLSIVSSNLDEFVMVRVGGLKNAAAAGSRQASDDGLTPEEQLDAISIRMRPLLERQARCLADVLLPELAARGIRILRWPELDEPQRRSLRRHFVEQIFPVLTPQAITRAPGHPFPLVANLRLSLAALVRDPRSGPDHFAYFKLPESLPRFVPLSEGREFVPLEDVVRANLDVLYPGREVRAAHCFRVTRSGDLALEEESAASLLLAIEEQAKRRPYGAAVRLEVERAMPQAMRDLLLRELQFEEAGGRTMLGPGDLYEVEGLLDPAALRELADLPSPELQYPPFRGRALLPSGGSIFSVIAQGDVLVHHPYDAFDATVERFISEAADDPDTLAIKLTLYRAGGRSGIVDALMRAAEAGKEVFVFVEVKARFDEERNIDWAKKLEDARIRVVYGLVRLKMHAKAALVVRREGDVVRRYVHVGTGNYNAATAAVYTDLGLLTADEALGADVHDLFNELSGSSRPPGSSYKRLLVGPTQLLPRFIALIDREAQHVRAGQGGRVRAKLNGLADAEIVSALYRASQAGVAVDLVVRGICTLRPGVVGLSERIRVTSAVGRFLEHARIYHFANAGEDEYYIGSADWRPRNLRRRVEVVAPVRDPRCRARLDEILTTELDDPAAWELDADGSYRRRDPGSAAPERLASAQQQFMERACAP